MSRPIRHNAEITWARLYLTLEGETPIVASSRYLALMGDVSDLAMSSMKEQIGQVRQSRLAVR